jgi:kynureninase
MPLERSYAEELDAADPLARFRDRFVRDIPAPIYLDGNSLGPLPRATRDRIAEVVAQEWGSGLVRSWHGWIELPGQVGDLLGEHLIGAAPGQVAVCDSTTVNLYKLACAALDARPGRTVIVTDDDNFPTDRYVLQGIAEQRGGELRMVGTDMDQGIDAGALRDAVDSSTALVSLSHVAYRSGALADMATITDIVHEAGALALWDLCHSVGAVPVELDATGADLAVGCTYKYLNAGPGAPAFLYVRRDLQPALRQPVWGWFGQRDQFEMGPAYDPAPGIGQFLTGSPQIIGTVAVQEGARLLAEAGMGRLRVKGLAPLGGPGAAPRGGERRGSHVTLAHPEAWRISQALILAGVIGDYRTPDRLRLGPAPAYTRFTDVWDALDILRAIMTEGTFRNVTVARTVVT